MDSCPSDNCLGPKQQAQLLRGGLVLLFMVVMVTTVVLLLSRHQRSAPRDLQVGAKKSPHRVAQLCNTVSCRLAASLLNETVHGDPCDDFYAYVCSGWLKKPSFTSTHDQQETLLVSGALSGLRRLTPTTTTVSRFRATTTTTKKASTLPLSAKKGTSNKPIPSAVKAAALFGDCLESSMLHRADALVTFLRDVGLSFINASEHPIDLATKLDLFYNLKTLFDLRRHPTWRRPDGRPMLSMGRRYDLDSWRLERAGPYSAKDLRGLREDIRHGVDSTRTCTFRPANRTKVSLHGDVDVHVIIHRIMSTEEAVLEASALIPEDDPDRHYAIIPLLTNHSSPENDSSSSASLMLEGLSEVAIGPAGLSSLPAIPGRRATSAGAGGLRHLGAVATPGSSHRQGVSSRMTETPSASMAISRLMPYPTVIPFMEELDFHRGWEEAELVFREVSEATINFMSQRGVTLPATDGHFELKLPTTNQLDAFYSEVGTNTKVQGKPTFMDKYLSTLSNIRSKEIFSILQVEEPSTSYPLPPLYGRHAQASFQ
ncbi:hypothetical protein MTO96_003315 [Rhipicephalus appendiculatus]